MKLECVGEPVSWLRLERFALGELPVEERSRVREHLERCPACQACLDIIRTGPEPVLRPLPSPAPARPRRMFGWLGAAAVALAGVALLLLFWPAGPKRHDFPGAHSMVKGGEIALVLVRERGGAIQRNPVVFAPGDRFKARLTCPPPGEPMVELVVFQGGETFFPLSRQSVVCGNEVPLSGAFGLDGDAEAAVCLIVGDPPSRKALRLGPPMSSPAVCAHLRPAPSN